MLTIKIKGIFTNIEGNRLITDDFKTAYMSLAGYKGGSEVMGDLVFRGNYSSVEGFVTTVNKVLLKFQQVSEQSEKEELAKEQGVALSHEVDGILFSGSSGKVVSTVLGGVRSRIVVPNEGQEGRGYYARTLVEFAERNQLGGSGIYR